MIDINIQKIAGQFTEGLFMWSARNASIPGAGVHQCYRELASETFGLYWSIPLAVDSYGDRDSFKGYANLTQMQEDIQEKKRLRVYRGGEAHSHLSRRENFQLRAVHDYYGHYRAGACFNFDGEVAAWESHVSEHTSPFAKAALFTEVIGQLCYVYNNPANHDALLRQDHGAIQYAPQRGMILPAALEYI